MDFQKLIDRVRNILLSPRIEWPVVAAEPATAQGIFQNYVLLLAAIGPVAGLIGNVVFGYHVPVLGTIRITFGAALGQMFMSYALTLGITYGVAFIIDAMAPNFGAEKNFVQALKAIAYASTAVWVAGVIAIVPELQELVVLGLIYSVWLFWLGLPQTMKCPPEKAGVYAASAAIAWVLLFLIAYAVLAGQGAGRNPFGLS